MSPNPDTKAPSGRKKTIGHRASVIGDSAKPPAALGHASQSTSSLDGANEGGASTSSLGFDSLGNALPPSAITENELPKGWRWVRIREIGNVQLGRQRAPKHQNGANMRPYLRVANVFEDRIDLSDVLTMNFTPREFETFALRANDILLNEGQSLHLVGRPALYRDDLPGACFQNTLVRFRCGPEVEPKFALTIFRGYLHTGKFQKIARWTTNIAHLGAQRFAEMPFPLPPLPEQRRIVAEIEKQFTRLEAGVAALRRVQAKLKRYRAAVLKAACEGRLVPTEAALARSPRSTKNGHPAFETGEALLARILTERRQNWQGRGQYKEPAAPDTSNLQPLPEGWTWASVEQVTSLVATGATPYRGKPAYWEGGTLPWVTSGALNDKAVNSAKEFITPLAIEETNAKLFPPGTLLVALYGEGKTRGMVSELRIEAATNQACAALLFGAYNSALSPFLRVFLLKNYNDVRLLSSGGVQPNLSLSIVKQTKIPLPPLAEQTRIVEEVERRLSVVEELESVVTANLQRATRLRQSILQKAFTGELL